MRPDEIRAKFSAVAPHGPPVIKPQTPHEKMRQLDMHGEPYVVTNVDINGAPIVKRADVLSHGDRWLCVRPINSDGSPGRERWIAWTAIIQLEVEEL